MDNTEGIPKAPGKICSHPGCEVIIHPHWEQRSGKGFTYWVDTTVSSKPFVHRHNDETFGKDREYSNGTAKAAASSKLARIVLGELADANASEGSIEIARELLRLASSSNNAAAIQALDRLSSRLGEIPHSMKKPTPSQTCPLCNRKPSGDVFITLSPGAAADMQRFSNMILDDDDE